MSAKVSFTKRAAAELSRCFNGLTSVNRSSSKKSTTSSNSSTIVSDTSSTSGVASNSSLSDSCPATHNEKEGQPDGSPILGSKNSSRSKSTSNAASGTNEVTLLITKSTTSSSSSTPQSPFGLRKAASLWGQSSSSTPPLDQQHQSSGRKGKSLSSGPGNIFQSSVQTLITKANTSLSPFKESIHVNGTSNRNTSNNSTSSSIGSASKPSDVIGRSQKESSHSSTTTTTSMTAGCMTPTHRRSSQDHRRSSGPPPAAPRKTSIARRKNFLLSLQKPQSLDQLFKDHIFLNHFFARYFTPKERTVLSQVCSHWKDTLYNDPRFWTDLLILINFNDLRRCSPLAIDPPFQSTVSSSSSSSSSSSHYGNSQSVYSKRNSIDKRTISHDENRNRSNNNINSNNNNNNNQSSSNNIRSKFYFSLEQRGFNSICLYGATDSDVIDFASRMSASFMRKILHGSVRSSSISDKGLEIFLASLSPGLQYLGLSGCNEITDSGLWTSLVVNITSLTITDCINIADETVSSITQMLTQLKTFNLQAYHVTDSAMSYFASTPCRVHLRCFKLENCWEIGNQGVLSIAHGLPNLTTLSLSGCSKINDDAIEVIAEQLRHLSSLNLSWCSRITDASLEYIACDLADTLRELIIDRCVHVTDIGLGYAATMTRLSILSLRWCPHVRDFGVQTLCSMKTLTSLAVSGCPQLTASGLSCLAQIQSLEEIELTNCSGATPELVQYLRQHLPASTVIIE